MNSENQFGKNYWIALILSLIVLMSYPLFLKWVTPQASSMNNDSEIATEAPLKTNDTKTQVKTATLSAPEGPFLETAPKPAIIPFENETYQIEFSTLGGTITRLVFKDDQTKEITQKLLYEGDIQKPGLFGINFSHESADLSQTIFKLHRKEGKNSVFEFEYEKPEQYRVIKRYVIRRNPAHIQLEVYVENLSGNEKHFPIEFFYRLNSVPDHAQDTQYSQVVAMTDKIKKANESKVIKKGFLVAEPSEWGGILKKYFALLVRPDWKIISQQYIASGPHEISGQMKMEPITLAPKAHTLQQITIYPGQQRYEVLKSFGFGFEQVLALGFFGLFKIWLLLALKFFHRFTHNFGWDIIILTLIIKGLFTPLTHMSFENMKKMQVIQPRLKSLQERHKGDPAKLNKEMMELYRRNKINPMMGCLPMLLQIPIFISFYQVLAETIELKGAPFIFWMHDLSEPDRFFSLPFSLPVLGDAINILPILMIISMVWQQKLTPTAGATPEQTKIMAFMPLIFGFLFYGMPSGLVLYWFVNNVLSIIHQVFVKRIVVELHHEDRE